MEASWSEVLEPMEQQFEGYRNETIEKWNNKIRAANGIPLQKKFKVINQSIVSQIQAAATDRERLVKRTQLRRSQYSILGQEVSIEVTQAKPETVPDDDDQVSEVVKDKHLQDYHTEIFDDGDFYQQLLKELIDNRVSDSTDPVLLEMRYAQLKQLQVKKSKKVVDTRASKGRKIRYQVQEKIMNFMAPEPRGTWHDEMIAELFKNLLGQGGDEVDEVVVEDGFKMFS